MSNTIAAPTPTELAIRGGLDIAEQLAKAHWSLLRIHRVLREMRRMYASYGDTAAASVVDAILTRVIADELAENGLAPKGGEPA